MPETIDIQNNPVFSYPLASANMRYIEVGERKIYLTKGDHNSLVFHGEIPGCGPGCSIDLSEILLEYAMSCEECGEQGISTEEAIRFGKILSGILVEKTRADLPNLKDAGDLSMVFRVVLDSLHTAYKENIQDDYLEFTLECCPLSECAEISGLGRNVEIAFISLFSLLTSLMESIAPGWQLKQPDSYSSGIPLEKIIVSSK